MTNKFLGQFLLEQTAISAEQLQAALKLQSKTIDASMATRAMGAGFLSQADVDRISGLANPADKSFVERAADEGLLSPDRIATLRRGAIDPQQALGDALVETGALTADELGKYLELCNEDIYKEATSSDDLVADQPNADVLKVIANQYSQGFRRTLQVLVQYGKCHDDIDRVAPCDYSVYQGFTGDFEGEIHLNLSEALMLRIASKLLAEETLNVNALVIDAANEFQNIVNGNICAKLSLMGLKVDMKPPLYYRHPSWGERSGSSYNLAERAEGHRLTVLTLAHPTENPEICVIDASAS